MCSKINNFNITVNCAVIEDITSNLPTQLINCNYWKLPENIQLTEPGFNKLAKIDLPLGAGFLYVVCLGKLSGKIIPHQCKYILAG
jgi:hypothetical protein